MKAFIDDHRDVYEVDPICKVLPIAPSIYDAHRVRQRDSQRQPARTQRRIQIQRVWDKNFQVYGVRTVWHPLRREGMTVARCTVARLMWQVGLQGVVRGKVIRTTVSDKATPCPLVRVNR